MLIPEEVPKTGASSLPSSIVLTLSGGRFSNDSRAGFLLGRASSALPEWLLRFFSLDMIGFVSSICVLEVADVGKKKIQLIRSIRSERRDNTSYNFVKS